MTTLSLRLIGWDGTWHLGSAKQIRYTPGADPDAPIVTPALALAMAKSARAQVRSDRGPAAHLAADILGQPADTALLYGMYALSWVCTQRPTASVAVILRSARKLWAQAQPARQSSMKSAAAAPAPRPAAPQQRPGLSGTEVGVCKLAAQYRQAWGYTPVKPGAVTAAVLAARTSASESQWRRSADSACASVLRASVSAAVAASGVDGRQSTSPAPCSQELSYTRAHQLGHNAWAMGPWYVPDAAQLSRGLAVDASP